MITYKFMEKMCKITVASKLKALKSAILLHVQNQKGLHKGVSQFFSVVSHQPSNKIPQGIDETWIIFPVHSCTNKFSALKYLWTLQSCHSFLFIRHQLLWLSRKRKYSKNNCLCHQNGTGVSVGNVISYLFSFTGISEWFRFGTVKCNVWRH